MQIIYTEEQYRMYRQSLLFVLFSACARVFPDKVLHVHQSVNRSTYCEIPGIMPTEADLQTLRMHMDRLIAEKFPFSPQTLPKEAAITLLRKSGDIASADHLSYSAKKTLTLLPIMDRYYSVYGKVFPHAGYLSSYELLSFDAGFLLRYPHPSTGGEIPPFHFGRKILDTISEYRAWSEVIGIENVYDLNRTILGGQINSCINISEIMHEKKLSEIADTIKRNILTCKVILISGPSSSGKTTTANRLMLHLRALGLSPQMISLDDYYLGRSKTPVDENGKPNYEDIDAIDYSLFALQLRSLIAGETVSVPRFDFTTAERAKEGRNVKLTENSVLLVEGIHALNEKLTRGIPTANLYRIYCSALTVLCFDRYNPISPTDTRLIRRIIRDSQFRSTDAAGTLSMWSDVQKGEIKNIFPYEETADVIFNTALSYEFAVYKEMAEQLLYEALSYEEHRETVERLLEFLGHFVSVSQSLVPGTSILREFIGGSTLHDE
ncbi:MAG: nucleoside kinase [Ruminococcaceae bacterium]|nr:nucleoside kinase [Oscillospiraceae bacterium]